MRAYNKKRKPKHMVKTKYSFYSGRYWLHDKMNTKRISFKTLTYKLGYFIQTD